PLWACVLDAGAAGVPLPPAGIGIQAMQLSPYRAGLAGRHLQRLPVTPASPTCSFPLRLSPSGQSDDPGAFLRAPPDCVRDSTPRSAAHPFDASGSSIEQRLCVARPGAVPPAYDTPYETRSPHWPWGRPGRYCASASYRRSAGAAPLGVAARDRSALPPEPVGCRFTSADTRGKSARFRAG